MWIYFVELQTFFEQFLYLGNVDRRKSTASSTEVTWDMSRGYLHEKNVFISQNYQINRQGFGVLAATTKEYLARQKGNRAKVSYMPLS